MLWQILVSLLLLVSTSAGANTQVLDDLKPVAADFFANNLKKRAVSTYSVKLFAAFHQLDLAAQEMPHSAVDYNELMTYPLTIVDETKKQFTFTYPSLLLRLLYVHMQRYSGGVKGYNFDYSFKVVAVSTISYMIRQTRLYNIPSATCDFLTQYLNDPYYAVDIDTYEEGRPSWRDEDNTEVEPHAESSDDVVDPWSSIEYLVEEVYQHALKTANKRSSRFIKGSWAYLMFNTISLLDEIMGCPQFVYDFKISGVVGNLYQFYELRNLLTINDVVKQSANVRRFTTDSLFYAGFLVDTYYPNTTSPSHTGFDETRRYIVTLPLSIVNSKLILVP